MIGYRKIKARLAGSTMVNDGATLTIVDMSPAEVLFSLTAMEQRDAGPEAYGEWCMDTPALLEGAYGGASLRLCRMAREAGWTTEVRYAQERGRWEI